MHVDIRRGNTLRCAAHKKKTTRCLTTTLHPNKCRIKDVLSNDLIIRGHHEKLTDSTHRLIEECLETKSSERTVSLQANTIARCICTCERSSFFLSILLVLEKINVLDKASRKPFGAVEIESL